MHFSVRSIPSITKDSGAGKDACTISMGWRITPTYQTRQAAPKVRQNLYFPEAIFRDNSPPSGPRKAYFPSATIPEVSSLLFDQFDAAIQGASVFHVIGSHRGIGTIAKGGESGSSHPILRGEHMHHGGGALARELHIRG